MAFNKIQPEQLQMPTFVSTLGDILFDQSTDTGVTLNITRGLTGDFNITGSLHVNKRSAFLLAETGTNIYDNAMSGTAVVQGISNDMSNCLNSIIINGISTNMEGENNVSLIGRNQSFSEETQACLGIGREAIFPSTTTGAVILTDDTSDPVEAVSNNSLNIGFGSGTYFGGSVYFADSLHIASDTSGVFSGDINVLGNSYLTGFNVATMHDVTGHLSGNFVEGSGITYLAMSGTQLVFRQPNGLWTGVQTTGIT